MTRQQKSSGFTLIEMAIVMVIIGLILTVTLPLLVQGIAQQKLTKSRTTLSALKQEIIGYAMKNHYLPSLATLKAQFANAQDPWGHQIAYYSEPNITGSGDLCAQGSTAYSVTDGTNTYSNVAFVLAGRGANQNLQINEDIGGTAPTTRTVRTYTLGQVIDNDNTGTDATFDLAAGTTRAEEYDDVVEYVTLDYLNAKICSGEGATPIAAAITFDNMENTFPKTTSQNFVANNAGAVNVGASEILFGNGFSDTRACLWYDGLYPASNLDELECYENANSISICRARDEAATAGVERWDTLRFVFKFSVLNSDTRADSYEYMAGLVFAIINASDAGNTGTTVPCGGGSGNDGYLGYANTGIDPPKFGVELDLYPNDNLAGADDQNDPSPNETTITWAAYCGATASYANHVAAVYYATETTGAAGNVDDNMHGRVASAGNLDNPAFTQIEDLDCDGDPDTAAIDGFLVNATAWEDGTPDRFKQWLEDGEDHWIRVEIHRGLAVDATHVADPARYKYTTKIWIDDTPNATFLNVGADVAEGLANADYFDMKDVWLSAANHAEMHEFRFGWTTAVDTNGAGAVGVTPLPQTISVSSFGFNGTGTAP